MIQHEGLENTRSVAAHPIHCRGPWQMDFLLLGDGPNRELMRFGAKGLTPTQLGFGCPLVSIQTNFYKGYRASQTHTKNKITSPIACLTKIGRRRHQSHSTSMEAITTMPNIHSEGISRASVPDSLEPLARSSHVVQETAKSEDTV